MHGCLFPEARVIDANSPIDPLEWWKMYDGQFPPIAKLARTYLAIPASSAPSERVFSRAKLIQQRQRWNFLPQRLEACVMQLSHAEAQCMVNYKYLDSKRAVCITACYVSQTQFLYL